MNTLIFRVLILTTCLTFQPALAGVWGTGPFDNDDALDWLAELEVSGVVILAGTLKSTSENAGYLQAPDCSAALAAAEVVAAARGKPRDKISEEVRTWLARVRPAVTPELAAAARASVNACLVAETSELRQLWMESGSDKDWLQDTTDLLKRLQ